jgi:hypothetical protein
MDHRALLLSLLLLSACSDSEPSSGSVTGSVGGTSVAGEIDADESFFYLSRKATCVDIHRDLFFLSFGGGALQIHGHTLGMVSIIQPPLTDPLPLPTAPRIVGEWVVDEPAGAVLVTGSVTLDGTGTTNRRIAGSFRMEHDDASTAEGEFELRYAMDRNTGPRTDCNGDGDWDDD